jgi:hypothetical protein
MSVQSHLDTVTAARARYDSLSGLPRAQAICAFVVWAHRAEGWGRFKKGDGTLSADVIALKLAGEAKAHTFDILADAENAAKPQWGPTQPTGRGDLARWVAPVRPADVDVSPVVESPETGPEPLTPFAEDIAGLRAELAALRSAIEALAARPFLDIDTLLDAVVNRIGVNEAHTTSETVNEAHTTSETVSLMHSHKVSGLTLSKLSQR